MAAIRQSGPHGPQSLGSIQYLLFRDRQPLYLSQQSGPFDVVIEIAQEHLVHRSEEALNATSPLWFARGREHKLYLQICRDLIEVVRCEIGAVVGIEDVRNAANLPMGRTCSEL